MRDKSESCVDIPERFIDKDWIIDIAFSTDNNCVCFADIAIGSSHDTTAAINRISTVYAFDLALISPVFYL